MVVKKIIGEILMPGCRIIINVCFFVHFAAIYYWLFPLLYLIVKKSPVILGQKFEPISSMFVNFAI